MGAPRCFFKEGNTIPKIKERNQTDKVKGKKKSGKPAQASARRVMTAKLKKELALPPHPPPPGIDLSIHPSKSASGAPRC